MMVLVQQIQPLLRPIKVAELKVDVEVNVNVRLDPQEVDIATV